MDPLIVCGALAEAMTVDAAVTGACEVAESQTPCLAWSFHTPSRSRTDCGGTRDRCTHSLSQPRIASPLTRAWRRAFTTRCLAPPTLRSPFLPTHRREDSMSEKHTHTRPFDWEFPYASQRMPIL